MTLTIVIRVSKEAAWQKHSITIFNYLEFYRWHLCMLSLVNTVRKLFIVKFKLFFLLTKMPLRDN